MMKCCFRILFFVVSVYCSPPNILINPIGGIYSPQSSAILDCVVSGDPVPDILWFAGEQTPLTLNKHVIYDNGTLEITGFSSLDNGYYYCVARNEFGSVQSLKALQRVAFIDTIIPTSKPLSYQENAPFNLSCDVPQSLPPVQVTWYRGNTLVTYNNRIGMTLDNTLVFSYTKESDSGPWTCKVKNNVIGGTEEAVNSYLLTLESSAPVAAHPSIQFVYTPKSQSAITGTTVQLQCFAIGRPVPTYTWKKDGFTVSSSDQIMFEQDSRVIVIRNITSSDSGSYTCQAKQDETFLYYNASLVVKDPPLITSSFNAITQQYASLSVSLECTAKGNLPINWIWRNNTNQITESDDIDIINNGSESTLVIHNLGPYDSGVIQCVAYNSDTGEDQASELLEIITKEPEINTSPSDIFVIVGENITLNCICMAFPYPSFSWLEDNAILTLSGNHYLADDDPFSGNLIINSVQTSDTGVYQCVCGNVEGVRSSTAGIVTVIDEPVISAYPNGSLVREGDSVILHCMIKDIVSTTISYSWTRDFKPVSDNVDITLYGNGSLYILNFNHSSHSGKYECNVQLEVISSTAQPIIFDIGAAYITTVPPAVPSPPLYVSVASVTSTTVLLHWTESVNSGGLQILEYIIEILNHGRNDCETGSDFNLTESSTVLKIDSLLPHNKYSVLVYARNSLGISLPSEMSGIFSTAEEVPSAPPVNVNATENERIGELIVNWEFPPCTERNGIIVNYTLTYVVLTTGSSTTITTTTNVTSVTLTDLPVLQDYKIQVAASTSIGTGPFSDFITASTSIASVPNEPRNVTAVFIDPNLYISWEPPLPRRNEPVNELTDASMYLIIHESDTFYVSVTYYTHMDVEEDSNISFTIAALNSFGVGETVTIHIIIPESTPSTNETTEQTVVTMNEEQALYEHVWFIGAAAGVGGVVILFLLSICVLGCVVSYLCKRKHKLNNNNSVSPIQLLGSASSLAYPNRKFTVLDKMMQVESMSSQDYTEIRGTVNTAPNDTESVQSEGTVQSQTSSLRSKYQYRSPIEEEEYQKLNQFHNKNRRSSNGSQKRLFSSSLVSSKKNNNTHYKRRARSNTTREAPASPTDTVSSFEYESQAHILQRMNNVSRIIQHRDNSPESDSQTTTTDIGYDSSLDRSQVHQHSRNGAKKKSSKQVPLDLARMTALPRIPQGTTFHIPHHMPSALEQDLSYNNGKINELPKSHSRSYDSLHHMTSTLTSLV